MTVQGSGVDRGLPAGHVVGGGDASAGLGSWRGVAEVEDALEAEPRDRYWLTVGTGRRDCDLVGVDVTHREAPTGRWCGSGESVGGRRRAGRVVGGGTEVGVGVALAGTVDGTERGPLGNPGRGPRLEP